MIDHLQYLCDLPIYREEQPYELYGFPEIQSKTRTNCDFETKEVTVTDCRDAKGITLQGHGFMFLKHESAFSLEAKYLETVDDDTTILMGYLEETTQLVRKLLKPADVICFDWRFRRRDPMVSGRIPPRALKDIRNFALPTGDVVHCDYSASGGADRLRIQLLRQELEEFYVKERQAMIVNVWRPLHIVENTPLLLCDRRTVPKDDLIEVDKVLSDILFIWPKARRSGDISNLDI
ncbi:hypothetical protein EV127DRAFT_493346 [Xylaria flabelliformis]|nr:hypothetical protein EV127DRAFT_493346 [Xylaria flabelliformis]